MSAEHPARTAESDVTALEPPVPRHVAIIMDGNGRWASQRGRPRTTGHLAGARTVRNIVEHARRSGIPVLTLYAFSSDNWQRPGDEVSALMGLFRRYLAAEVPRCVDTEIRLSVIGRRDRLSPALVRAIEAAESATASCSAMRLRIAVDYSARDAIVEAAQRAGGRRLSRTHFSQALAEASHDHVIVPDVDLLIRTGGEQRLSDFLLWECAYAELMFSRRMWPEFTTRDFDAALLDYARRDRRYGAVTERSA
ncbi:MAG TPA: polyprenyl diphosphate synthase [Gemmatimonadaceae bacterium]